MVICPCQGERVQVHQPPLVFDLERDPGETTPLDTSLAHVREALTRAEWHLSAQASHLARHPPGANQFDHVPRPWLQPCCNFPWCSCQEANSTVA